MLAVFFFCLKCRQVVPVSIYSTAHCNMLWRGWIRPGLMVTGCSGLVFSMRWTVGEMDSRLWTIWLEPFDGHTVHKTVHLHTAGMTTKRKKSILQSRANVFPKMKNRAFPVNDTSVWNNTAYFPGFCFFLHGSSASDGLWIGLCINTIGIVVGKSKLVIWGLLMRTKFATTVLNTA